MESQKQPSLSTTLLFTPSGSPYIPLTTRSPEPIFLTPLFSSDAQAMTDAMSDPIVNLALISPPTPYTLENAEWFINLSLGGNAELPLCSLRVGAPDASGRHIGGCALIPKDLTAFASILKPGESIPETTVTEEKDKSCSIGYWLSTKYHGLGIMKPAVAALIPWGREYCGVTNVIIRVLETNIRSRSIVTSFPQFILQDGFHMETWPESKGGGSRKTFDWVWKA
ncbi:acyl-CoA N-acyltransferase [Tricladium varicosporioides]|nr:acyl-CoA N-acyltransferase [Hymenoscyphus varicosporioides]